VYTNTLDGVLLKPQLEKTMYINKNPANVKNGTETLVATLTDCMSLVLIITLGTQIIRGRYLWKLNTALLQDEEINQILKTEWNKWKQV
jgi:hypothetical protein